MIWNKKLETINKKLTSGIVFSSCEWSIFFSFSTSCSLDMVDCRRSWVSLRLSCSCFKYKTLKFDSSSIDKMREQKMLKYLVSFFEHWDHQLFKIRIAFIAHFGFALTGAVLRNRRHRWYLHSNYLNKHLKKKKRN